MFLPNLKFLASSVPEIIAIGVLGGGCGPSILGKRKPLWLGVGAVRKSVGEFL